MWFYMTRILSRLSIGFKSWTTTKEIDCIVLGQIGGGDYYHCNNYMGPDFFYFMVYKLFGLHSMSEFGIKIKIKFW